MIDWLVAHGARRLDRPRRRAADPGGARRALRRALGHRRHRARGQDARRRLRRGGDGGGHRLGLARPRRRHRRVDRCCPWSTASPASPTTATRWCRAWRSTSWSPGWRPRSAMPGSIRAGRRRNWWATRASASSPCRAPRRSARFRSSGRSIRSVISGHNILVYAAAAAVPLIWWVVYRTRFGLRLRAAGENPHALDTAGVSVAWVRYRALIITRRPVRHRRRLSVDRPQRAASCAT